MSAISAKAVRLLAEGRVKPDPSPVQVFHVEGDHGTYTVAVGAHVQLCSCPATGSCSHIVAACQRLWASPDEVALMDDLVAARQAQKALEAEALFARLGAA